MAIGDKLRLCVVCQLVCSAQSEAMLRRRKTRRLLGKNILTQNTTGRSARGV
jgi:hypothetical protein